MAIFLEACLPKKSQIFLQDLLFIFEGLTFAVFRNTFSIFLKVNNKNLRVSVKQSASIRPDLPVNLKYIPSHRDEG